MRSRRGFKKSYPSVFIFLVVQAVVSDLAHATDQKSRLDTMNELKSVHNNGIACDFVAKSRSEGKPIATQLIPQKKLWMNLGRDDIVVDFNDLIANGKLIGFKGKIYGYGEIEATKTRSLEDKDGMPQDEYIFVLKKIDGSKMVINAISQCDA